MNEATASPASGEDRKRVLLVEDHPDMRETAGQALALLGYDVISTDSAETALQEMQAAGRVDILLTDISLPGKSGLDLAALCVERFPQVKVIFASGYGEVSEDLGVRGLSLPKPYGIEDLRAVLEAAAG